jgi:ABC-type hemin transport system substrate-binding protein
MTEEEMERLSDMVVDKLVTKQKQLDQEFIKDLEASNVPIEVHERISNKDKMVMEITRLIVLLDALEKAEKYEQAAMCSERIKLLNMHKMYKGF